MNVGANGRGARRRRTWYRHRLRMQRTLVAVVVGMLLAGACWHSVAQYFSLPAWHTSRVLPPSFWVRANIHHELAFAAARSAKPTKFLARRPAVYPYSVVPGGVKDPDQLRNAALRDDVVRRHYTHFDFSHARLVRATEARQVYLSYRIRDTVFWTRKKISLHAGELLLTDGKITARARCGNQVSDSAKPEVSDEEPAQDVLDEPVTGVGSAPSFPNRSLLPASDFPAGAPNSPQLFAGGFYFPYVPAIVPLPSGHCHAGDVVIHGHCRPRKPSHAPEPSTMVLLGSGMGLIMWRYRKTVRPARAPRTVRAA